MPSRTSAYLPRARYFFFWGTGAAGFFAEFTPKGDAGTAAFFDCLGFLASRLLRFWPLAIEVLLIGQAVRHRLAAIQFSGWKCRFSSGQEKRSVTLYHVTGRCGSS